MWILFDNKSRSSRAAITILPHSRWSLNQLTVQPYTLLVFSTYPIFLSDPPAPHRCNRILVTPTNFHRPHLPFMISVIDIDWLSNLKARERTYRIRRGTSRNSPYRLRSGCHCKPFISFLFIFKPCSRHQFVYGSCHSIDDVYHYVVAVCTNKLFGFSFPSIDRQPRCSCFIWRCSGLRDWYCHYFQRCLNGLLWC